MSVASATTAPQPVMSGKVWGMILLLGLLWGGSFFFARIAVQQITPLVLVFERVALAALALQLYLAFAGPSFKTVLSRMPLFFGLGLLNNVIPFSLIFFGQKEMGAGVASVLNATTPMWTLIVATALTSEEKLSWNKLAGIAAGIAGTAVMIGPGLVAGLGGSPLAKFALIGAALSYAFAAVFARKYITGVKPELMAAGQLTASTFIMAPIVLLAYGPSALAAGSPPVWAAVAALAIFSTAFAYILFFRILAAAGATNTSLVTLVVPVFAILLGVAFLGEHLEWFEALGMVLIGSGLALIDGRLLKRA